MNQSPKVSVIIPVFNKVELTLQCIRALDGSTGIPFEIIVVDNASTDETRSELQRLWAPNDERWQNFLYVRNERNANFSGACNQGAALAKAPYLVFLNNDTIPFENWLDPIVAELDNPEVGVVGSKLVYPDGTIQHAGVAFMRETRFPYHPYSHFPADHPGANHRRELQVVTGACLGITKENFNNWGQFSTAYKNGGEDIELCLIARRHNKKVVYNPESVLIHLESQSPGRLDHNDENTKAFFDRFDGYLLSDEDAFYFEDGLYRLHRTQVEKIELKRFPDDETRKAWALVAALQRSFETSKYGSPAAIGRPVGEWPVDPDVHEWVGLVADKMGYFQAASQHFKEALMIQKVQARARALGEVNSSVFLNPHFSKYFARE